MRYNVANQLTELAEALGPEYTRSDLTPDFVRLLSDGEAEVRVAAAGKVASFCKLLTPPIITAQVSSARLLPRASSGRGWRAEDRPQRSQGHAPSAGVAPGATCRRRRGCWRWGSWA